MDKWQGKVAVVTGSSAGIGASVTKALANAGMHVVGLARRVEAIEALATDVSGSGRIYGRKCDVTNESEVLSAFAWIRDTLGGVDVFVNNAGIMKAAFLIDGETEDFQKTFDLNVVAACRCTREAVKHMRSTGTEGHIIIINSILGHRIPDVPVPLFNVYPATKYALTALSQTIRQELHFHKANIKLTSISPGMVDTEFLSAYDSTLYASLPKLNVKDVTSAVLYALGTPDYVQIEEIILQAMFRHNSKATEG